jgi:transcriptional regulator with XRE-family HTH domain
MSIYNQRDTPPTPIGRILKAYRLRHDLSQHKLADLLAIDHAYVSRIESGSRSPHPSQVGHYSRVLGLPEADIALAICGLEPLTVREEIAADLRSAIFREVLVQQISQAESALRMYDRQTSPPAEIGPSVEREAA